ncbi:protein of unknown function [Flavobacterium aquidurense]|uniref:DUF4249 domain-containing protein n=1 Tax=Flavobacterium frigidimaris TaxID=262320 RepID=A0ABX4BSS0_FLAFR|nr:DUF4249 domain-containing protein [Flavobacterium frigidimaris]OXA79874.1 hypothetical protein B0A65_07960 [Flavobacterium frigidimaris]SDZ39492.1 protein of unknown function [Flavobacterium aquidurense]
MELIIRPLRLLYKTFVLIVLCLSAGSCTEQYVFQNNSTFESILIVQANITNELKKQEIKITRSYRLEEDGPTFEKGAHVYVTDSDKNTFEFELEDFSGLYVSKNDFQAIPGKSYRLNIITKDGKSYSSAAQTLTTVNQVQVEPKVQTIDGIKGVQIEVSSYDPEAKSKFYRYEYEETYKVISPSWSPDKLKIDPASPNPEQPNYLIVPREGETRTCFTTKKSDDLILLSTVGSSEDRINLPIRFIDMKSPILNERYSIIVRQYIQNSESYTYYNTLKSLSTSSSLFSQVQPGFNYGNLKSDDNPDEKVVGYFEVSSVSSKRIFFNFRDLFVNDPYPPFYVDCKSIELSNCWPYKGCGGFTIYSLVKSPMPESVYLGEQDNFQTVIFVPAPCGDCTRISSNIKPLFWID